MGSDGKIAGLLKSSVIGSVLAPFYDSRLKGLALFKQLCVLLLDGTKVTGKGLKELAGHKQLIKISHFNTKVTNAGLKKLRAAMPKREIRRE